MNEVARLYKRSKSGKIQIWSIEIDGDKFRTIEGYEGMKMSPSEFTTCVAKNVGRANSTTPEEQAVEEVSSRIQKQLDKGYVFDVIDADKAKAEKISPMLAHDFNKYKDKIALDVPLASQVKYDGARCIATDQALYTRGGKIWVSTPHILNSVKELFKELEKLGLEDVKLDGELFNFELRDDFNKIISLIKKQKPTEEDLKESEEKIFYYIYDIDIPLLTFEERFGLLQNLDVERFPGLRLAPTVFCTLGGLDELYSQYLEMGMEGQMVRNSISTYENSRSKSLLKRKEFLDSELEIIDVEEGKGNRSGMCGNLVLRDSEGTVCSSNLRGTEDYKRELLLNKDKYIGKTATLRYQNRTSDGSYRFPVVISIAREDYE